MTLEIILPLRDPTAVIEQTIDSLVRQSDRNFSVLLSDNHSKKGEVFFALATERLQAVGIHVKRIKPPIELGRVEHWNWAHFAAMSEWLKPVFAGDWLETDYVAKLKTAAKNNPGCRYIYSPYILHRMDEKPQLVHGPWTGRFYSAVEMEAGVLKYGMQFGPPSVAAYEKNAFVVLGGYPTPLPICADSLLFCTMVSRFGALGFTEPLCHFNIHGARFSTNLPQRRKDSFREAFTYCLMLGYRAWADSVSFCKLSYARLLWRETRSYLTRK